MKRLILLVLLIWALSQMSYANDIFNAPVRTYELALKEDCEDLKEAAQELREAIDAITKPAKEGEKSELQRLQEELEQSIQRLADFEQPTVDGQGHGPDVKKEGERLQEKVDAAREALHEQAAEVKKKVEELLEKLKQLERECEDELTEAERNELDQQLDDYDDLPEEMQEEMDRLEEEVIASELERLEAELEKKEGETEEEYRKRLRGYRAKYPWLPPVKERGERRRDFDDRKKEWEDKMDKKWRKTFWEKIMEEIRRRIDEKIKESKQREEDQDNDGLPEDEEEYFYSFRFGYAQDVFDLPFSDRYFTVETLNDIQTSMYEDPDLFEALFKQLDGEFFFGTFSTAPEFVNHELSRDVRYGIVLSKDILSKLEGSIQLQYATATIKAHLPVTAISFTGDTRSILGDFEQHKRAVRTQLGINYRFSQRNLQPLAGLWLGNEQQNWRSTASIETIEWQASDYKTAEWSFGLNTALRWQSQGLWYSELRGQWGQFEGESRYGLGFSIGFRF
ncbi:MAG: hypothetical protein AAFN81_13860 [Bacteroidota bacterium]